MVSDCRGCSKWERRYRELESTLEAVLERVARGSVLPGEPVSIVEAGTTLFGSVRVVYCSASGVNLRYSFTFKNKRGEVIETTEFSRLNCFPLTSAFLTATEVEVTVKSALDGDNSFQDRKMFSL